MATQAIGGYLELELNRGKEYHSSCIKLNSGRAAFEYVLRARNYKKVYLPIFTCDAMLEPIHKLKLEYELYSIEENFKPKIDFGRIERDSVFVYNNYFGINSDHVKTTLRKITNVIIDNSQAFYAKPEINYDVFYSPRKFYGIPDGGYLYTNRTLDYELEKDMKSHIRFVHLIGRINKGAEEYYTEFKRNDASLDEPLKTMSALTQRLLQNIDYEYIKKVRKKNFSLLHSKLSDSNKLKFTLKDTDVPMVYPYLITNGSKLKKKLISKKIFVPTYWPNVKEWSEQGSFEYNLYDNLVALPIDQRYGKVEMDCIMKLIKNYG